MLRRFPLLCCILLYLTQPARALEILSLAPAVASVGQTVTLTGGPFPEGSLVRLGLVQIVPDRLEKNRIVFTLPGLAEGDYSLVILHQGKTSPAPVTLRVVEPTPWISSIEPSSIDQCSAPEERRVRVGGYGFGPGASLQIDNAAVPATQDGTDFLLTVPELSPGLHEVRILSAGGKSSEAHALTIDSQPEIFDVSQGEDKVTGYDLIVQGRNFLFSSVLVVDGRPISTTPTRAQTDSLTYRNCSTLIYHRHPYSREPKQVNLQVVNPGGSQSQIYQANIP